MAAGNALALWVVYDKPTDFPNQFVARKWMNEIATDELLFSENLPELRRQLPPNLCCLERMPGDDPKIVEVWL